MHGKITKILRLYSHGMGIKSICATLNLSRNTVRKYIRAYQELGKNINELLRLDEEHLQELLFWTCVLCCHPTPVACAATGN